jgi:ribose transport system ATP-binding protein
MTTQSTNQPARLRVDGLDKSFFGVKVLHDVSFEAHGGRVLGMVGENGSGKSTTMNLITGVLPRDGGKVSLDGAPFEPRSRRESDAAGIAFIQQELNIFPNLSVAENLFLVRPPRSFASLPLISRRQMHDRARDLLLMVDLHISPSTLAGQLSAGERQLLEIARGLASDARVFILDEPTSSLTGRESARLFDIVRRLQRRDVAILYISHNLEDVLQLCSDVVVMRDGRVTMRATTQGLTPNDLMPAMVGRTIDALFPTRPAVPAVMAPILEVCDLGEPGVLEGINLQLGRGEIVGIAGLMGSGRSELARMLFGLDRHSNGVVRVDGQVLPPGDINARMEAGVAFLTEDRRHEGLMPDASVVDNMALAALPMFASRAGRVANDKLLDAARALAQRLKLKSGDMRTTPIRTLSGGNQQKVILGRWLLRQPKVFILDEPTRGVDVGAKEEIYRLLAEMAAAGMAILMISSELEELVGLCDRIFVMRRGELGAHFERAAFDREGILRAAFGQATLDRAAFDQAGAA